MRFASTGAGSIVAAGLSLAVLAAPASATVLTFDVKDVFAGIALDPAYGDRVSATSDATGSYIIGPEGATPNVLVDYLARVPSVQPTGYNDLVNVFYEEPEASSLVGFVLTGDPGFSVTLSRLDVGNFGVPVTLPFVRVLDGLGTELFRQNDVALASSVGSSLAFSFAGLTDRLLRFEIGLSGLGGRSDNVGIDNVRFSQFPGAPTPPPPPPTPGAEIPVPAGLPLLAGGLALLGAAAWRRTSST